MAEDEIELNESELTKDIADMLKQDTVYWEKRMAGAKSNTMRTLGGMSGSSTNLNMPTPFERLADAMSALRGTRKEFQCLADRLVGDDGKKSDNTIGPVETNSIGLLNDIAEIAISINCEIAIIMAEIARIREKV